jgi:zinc protease
MKRLVPLALLVMLFFTACPTTRGSSRKPTDLPFDPAVKTGVLPNGLTYYIRANDKPEKRVELRLVVNAGSVLEDENQRGIAHFLEHLAFNGTAHFKKNELVGALEEMGMRFGNDLNASTSYDETVYRLQVPSDNAKGLDTGLLILEDWAHNIVLDDAEVEKERKVILEEWRSDRGADERISEEHLKTLFAGSRYLARRPIGSMETVASVKPETIRKFYTDWYRPDLMAVIVVGAVDPAAVEEKIKARFGGIVQPFFPRPRLEYGVPTNSFPTAAVVTDKEATSTSFRVYYRRPVRPLVTEADYRAMLAEYLYHSLLSTRLGELAQSPETPFVEAYSTQGRILRGMEATVLGVEAKAEMLEPALEAVLREVERARRFGFTATELEREKLNMLSGMEQSYAERDKRNSAALAQEYLRHFLEQEGSPGIEFEYELYKKYVPKITLKELNGLAARLFPDEDRVLLASAPDKTGVKTPEVRDLLAVFGRVKAAALTPYTDAATDAPLVAVPPVKGSVVSEEKDSNLGLVVWKLSNGARVTVKPTDFKNDEIVMRAYSYGGHSLAPDADYFSAAAAADLVTLSGLGAFTRPALDKKLSGIQAAVAPRIDEITEGLAGSARPKDINTLFELVYLYFTAAKIEPDAFHSYKEKMATALAQRQGAPENVFSDTLQTALTQNHLRGRPFTREDLDRVDAVAALRFYKDRFADASDFQFFFVGNIDPAALKPLVETWIGGVPGAGRKETWKDTGLRRPKGRVEKDLRLGKDPKSETSLVFIGDFTWNMANLTILRALSETADLRLSAVIREQEGGTYGISASDFPQRLPREESLFFINFGADPARIAALTDKVFAELEAFKTKGPTEQELQKAKEIVLKEREVNLKSNTFWAEVLKNYSIWGEPSGRIVEYADYLARVKLEDVKSAARKYLNRDRLVRVTLYPEGAK